MTTKYNALGILPKHYRRGDGYHVFHPEGVRWWQTVGNGTLAESLHEVEARKMTGIVPRGEKADITEARADRVIEVIKAFPRPIKWLALLCHGWKTGTQLIGGPQLARFADALAAKSEDDNMFISIYSCSTGGGPGKDGDGGWADKLRDAMCERGITHVTVDAHVGSGHATKRPFVRRFNGLGSPVGGIGGQWVVAKGTRLWGPWMTALGHTDLRFRYSSMTTEAIHRELLGNP